MVNAQLHGVLRQLQSLRKASIADHRRLEAEEGSDRQVADDLWGPWNPEGLVAK